MRKFDQSRANLALDFMLNYATPIVREPRPQLTGTVVAEFFLHPDANGVPHIVGELRNQATSKATVTPPDDK